MVASLHWPQTGNLRRRFSLSPLTLNSPGGTFNCNKQVIKCSSDLSDSISGQLTTEQLTRSWMTKWEQRQYWAICTWAPTTRGRYRFSSIVPVVSVCIVCAASVSCWSDAGWKVRHRPTYWLIDRLIGLCWMSASVTFYNGAKMYWTVAHLLACGFHRDSSLAANSPLQFMGKRNPRCSYLSFWK